MAKLAELNDLDATALTDLVRRKEVKPIGLVDSAIERIESLNPALHAVVTPTLAQPSFPLGAFDLTNEDPQQILQRMETFYPFKAIWNATGQPAMSVPLYWNREGLPVGIHFVGRFGDEATLIRLAAQLGSARPWAGRRPPLSC